MDNETDRIALQLEREIKALAEHPLYSAIRDEHSLRIFMRSHVFAVWDFQSLLKALQSALTCLEIPWLPTADPGARRLINEIVLDEESDEAPGGGYISHFELYIEAMRDCGADTGPIEALIGNLRNGATIAAALTHSSIPAAVAGFVNDTMNTAKSGEAHRIAAEFAYGREKIIPAMFSVLVEKLANLSPGRWDKLNYYLIRHIDCDSNRHGPLSRQLVSRLCGDDDSLWEEAAQTARAALNARKALWDEIHHQITSNIIPPACDQQISLRTAS